MVAAATTLRDTIESAWNLTGELSKVSTGTGPTLMDEVVQFWDRKQVVGNEVPKSITVEKINGEGNEFVVKHPHFNEVSDIYEITVYYRVIDVDEGNFSTSLDLIENMALEVVRILKTVYNPSVPTNIYYKTANSWTNEDMYLGNQPELRRKLRFQLITITSDNSEVYPGFSGVLIFDTSASQGDTKPGSDYTFLEVSGVKIREGYGLVPLLTKDFTKGVGVPFQTRGMFSGTFTAHTMAARTNILGSTIEKIQNIYKTQSNSPIKRQLAEVVLLHELTDTRASPNTSTFTTQSFMKIDDIFKDSMDDDLAKYVITGTLTRPTAFTEVLT